MTIPDHLESIIRACQAEVGVRVDGDPWDQTWIAIYKRLTGKDWVPVVVVVPTPVPVAPPRLPVDHLVDDRSEANIATLLPEVQPLIRQLVIEAGLQGIDIRITSGTRTYVEQDALFLQRADGKDNDKDGRIDEADENVTGARGGYSSHNFGLAADFTIFSGKTPIWESPLYKKVGLIAESLGLSWAGRWSKPDEPHVYLKPRWAQGTTEGAFITGLRNRKAAGQDLLA